MNATHKALAALLCAFVAMGAATAQDNARAPYTEHELALAQICVHEAGWNDAGERDCAAINAAITNRARNTGRTWMAQAHAYATRVFDRERRDRRAWVAWLRADGGRPTHRYPYSEAQWSEGHRPKWMARLALARQILSGRITHQCDGEPEHWGGRHVRIDQRRAESAIRRGVWRRLDCGDTRNDFFAVNRRHPR